MTTATTAVPSSWLAECGTWAGTGQPLCPSCQGGYLHPYRVQINLHNGIPWAGVSRLHGWVAVCVGNVEANRMLRRLHERAAAEAGEAGDEGGVDYLDPGDLVDVQACGFSMPMQAEP